MATSLASQIYGPMTISPPTIASLAELRAPVDMCGYVCQLICMHSLSISMSISFARHSIPHALLLRIHVQIYVLGTQVQAQVQVGDTHLRPLRGRPRVTPPATRTLSIGIQFAMLRPLQPGLFSGTAAGASPRTLLGGTHWWVVAYSG